MTSRHSVSRHLHLRLAEYDEIIPRFIPGYAEMLDAAVTAVVNASPRVVLDLGAGTGALSGRLLARREGLEVVLWDVDPGMLDQARARLTGFGDQARFVERSFLEPFPACDAIMASLALHHIRDLTHKTDLYHRAFAALPPGGVLVNADVTVPSAPEEAEAVRREWAAHLVASGIPTVDVPSHFAAWAAEDRYFSFEEEATALGRAGFDVSCPFRNGPVTVLVGRRPRSADPGTVSP